MTSTKKRPVLVLSNNSYNDKTNDILVAAITSNVTNKDYSVFITKTDLEVGDLKVDSCVRVDKIYSLSQAIVINTFGKVKSQVIVNVKDKLIQLTSQEISI